MMVKIYMMGVPRDGQGSGLTVGGNFGNFYGGGVKAIFTVGEMVGR